MRPFRQALHLLLMSLWVRRSPPRRPAVLQPRLRRSPPWVIRGQTALNQNPTMGSSPSEPLAAVRHWEGVGDPKYLLAEIEELREIAGRGGLVKLASLLERAAMEAREQVVLKEQEAKRSS